MEANPVWLVVGVVMLGPILLVVAALLAIMWARSWRGRADKIGHKTAELLQQSKEWLNQLEGFQNEYAAVQRAPYTHLAEELDQPIAELTASISALSGLLDALYTLQQSRPADRWEAVAGFWQTAGERRRLCHELEHRQKTLEFQIESSRAIWHEMENLPLETYHRAQSSRENIFRLGQVLAELRGLGLAGLGEAEQALAQARETSLQFPVAFTGTGPLPRSTLFDITSTVIEILDSFEPLLEGWLHEVMGWSEQIQLGTAGYQRILTTLTHLREVTSAAPPLLLDISSFSIHLNQLEERVRAQFEIFQTASGQDLGRHARAAARYENALRSSSEEHDRACQEALELERKLVELETKYAALESRLGGNSYEDISFVRDQSRQRLETIDARMDGLRPFTAKLLPGTISERISLADQLLGDLESLERAIQERQEQFDQLVGLLQSSDFQTGSAWIDSARNDIKAAQDTPEDGTENARAKGWTWRAKTDSLLRSLDGLEALQAQVMPASFPVSIPESALDGRLEQARRLAGLHSKIRPQVAQILRS